MKALTLITGGVRSGKSSFALALARERAAGMSKCFLATAEPLDEEMKARILRHRDERGSDFVTVEEPLQLSQTILRVQDQFSLVLVDCLTLWMSNLLLHSPKEPSVMEREVKSFLEVLGSRKTDFLIVTNETGWGVIPDNAFARRFVDELGGLNRKLVEISDEVILMISGIPSMIKGGINAKLAQ